MTISIKPAELVGAKIGDRVISTSRPYGSARHSGTLVGVKHALALIQWDGESVPLEVHPTNITLAPREWKVGDVVEGPEAYDSLPVETAVRDHGDGEVCIKRTGGWQCVIAGSYAVAQTHYLDEPRTIIYLPEGA